MSGSARSYTFRISSEGMQQFVQEMQRLSAGSTEANAAINRLIQSSPQLASSILTASDATERAAKRATELRQAQEAAATSAQTSGERINRASASLDALESRALAARRGVADLRGAMELLGASNLSTALGPVAGFVGNLADLFGTGALAAGRFEGAAGLLSSRLVALAGVVALPVFLQSVGLGINNAGEAADSASTTTDRWRATLERLNPTLESVTANVERLAAARRRDALTEAEIEFGRVLTTRGTLTGQVSDLDGQIARAERASLDAERRAADAAAAAAEAPLTGILANRGRLAQADAQARAADLAGARQQLEQLRARRAEIVTQIQGLSEAGEQFEQLRRRFSDPIYNEPAGPPAPNREPAGRGGAAPREFAELRGYAEAEALAMDTIRANMARNAQRQRDEEERAEAQSLQRREREAERSAERVSQYLADGLTNAFLDGERGFSGMLESIKRLAIAAPVRIGVEAVITPIAKSAISGITGAVGGQAGGAGGLAELFGLAQAGRQVASLTGFGGAGGVGGSVTGLLNTQLFTPTLGAEALTLGGALGGVGGGFALGNIAGSFTAGDSRARQTNSQIGSGVGAIAGTIIGGPLGGLVGGAAGGALGGLIGPGRAFSGGDAFAGINAQGLLTVTGSAGKNFEDAALLQQLQGEVDALNAQLQALGLRFDTNRLQEGLDAARLGIIGGGESGNPRTLLESLARQGAAGALTSDDPAVRAALFGGGGVGTIEEAAQRAQQVQQEAARLAQQSQASAAQAETLRQRIAVLTGEAETEAFQMAELERRFQRERAELAAIGVQDMSQIEAAHYLERVALQKRFAEESTRVAEQAAAEQKRIADEEARAQQQRNRTVGGFLEQITFGGLSTLSPGAQTSAARQALGFARAAVVDGGRQAELDELVRVAQATLPLIQRNEGITENFGALVADLSAVLRSAAPGADGAGLAAVVEGTDRVTEAVYLTAERNAGIMNEIRDVLTRQAAQIAALQARAA